MMKPSRLPDAPPIEKLRALGKVVSEEEVAAERAEYEAHEERMRQGRIRRVLEQVPRRYRECTLDTWQGYPEARAKVEAWDPGVSWCLVLYSTDNGVGKTHLGTAAWRIHIETRYPAIWRSVGELLQTIYAGFGSRHQDPDHDVEVQVAKAGLLMLDDLGRQHRGSEDARARLVAMLCARYDWQLPTIITTNLTAEEMRVWDAALADRIYSSESVIVGRQGESWRRR